MSQSPLEAQPWRDYQRGWNALNELIRSDGSWSGYERNNFYVNNRDGTFSEVSGAVGLDFPEDGRAFALADYDHDGRLEVFLKNRNGPQLRILHNEMETAGESLAFRLSGRKSNRDGIGATITVETDKGCQVKFLQAGSGFLSQHTKELHFGLGKVPGHVRATVRWPSGSVQRFEDLPLGHRVDIEEGAAEFHAEPFSPRGQPAPSSSASQKVDPPPSIFETWLLEPIIAPEFSLPNLTGQVHTLAEFRGSLVLLNFWATWCPPCWEELQIFEQYRSRWASKGLRLVSLNVNDPGEVATVRSFVRERKLSFPVLLASRDLAGVYNVLYRYLFSRRRDLGIPTSFLVDEKGYIIKVLQGLLDPDKLLSDLERLPRTAEDRGRRALPFPGTLYGGAFRRNYFSYGVAFLQRGYLDQAVTSFQQVLRSEPNYTEAHYNLGTLYLKKDMAVEAHRHLQRAVQLKPENPDAWNNLGMLAAKEGRNHEAIRYFQEAIRQAPQHAIALENLGNLYRQAGRFTEARQTLEQALQADPEDPDINYSLGLLFAQQQEAARAQKFLQRALELRPEFPEALNNLGVLYLRIGKQAEARAAFEDCLRVDPGFDQPYFNLARLLVTSGKRQKAKEVLRDLLKLQPGHPQALKILDFLKD